MRRSLAVLVIASFLLSGCANDGSHFDSRTDSSTLPVFVLAAALLGGAIAVSH